MTMYAKNLPIPPKFDYPFQQQQRYSGAFIISDNPQPPKELPAETLQKIEETVRRMTPSQG